MVIERAIVHNVIKEQHQTDARIQFKKNLFRIDQRLQEFVEELERVYQRHGGKGYGIFEADAIKYPFQGFMDNYLKKMDNNVFYQFSEKATNLFKYRLVEAQASTGGYLFIIHYKMNSDKEYLALVVLNDKIGYAIQQDTLELMDVINLNMEHLSMGARIDLRRYRDHKDESYLSFIRGKKKVRNYFTEFIGCVDYQTSKESTERTIRVLYEYCDLNKIGLERRRKMESSLYEFLKVNREVDLEILSKNLAPESAPALYSMFQEAEIADYFDPDQKEAKKLTQFRYERNGLRIEFPKTKLDSREVLYYDDKRELRIRDRDGEIGSMIRNELF